MDAIFVRPRLAPLETPPEKNLPKDKHADRLSPSKNYDSVSVSKRVKPSDATSQAYRSPLMPYLSEGHSPTRPLWQAKHDNRSENVATPNSDSPGSGIAGATLSRKRLAPSDDSADELEQIARSEAKLAQSKARFGSPQKALKHDTKAWGFLQATINARRAEGLVRSSALQKLVREVSARIRAATETPLDRATAHLAAAEYSSSLAPKTEIRLKMLHLGKAQSLLEDELTHASSSVPSWHAHYQDERKTLALAHYKLWQIAAPSEKEPHRLGAIKWAGAKQLTILKHAQGSAAAPRMQPAGAIAVPTLPKWWGKTPATDRPIPQSSERISFDGSNVAMHRRSDSYDELAHWVQERPSLRGQQQP